MMADARLMVSAVVSGAVAGAVVAVAMLQEQDSGTK